MITVQYILQREEVENIGNITCCGKPMIADGDTGKFLEMVCTKCGDIVYMKKKEHPQMVDD